MPIEIHILGKSIPMYGLLCVLGVLAAMGVAFFLAHKKKMDLFDFCLNIVYCLAGAFIGAKLLFIIVSWDLVKTIFQNYSFINAVKILLRGGYVFYGGFIGGLGALLLSLHLQKQNIFKHLSIFATVLPLGHAIGRIGCFAAGCCYGMEYDGPLSYTYTHAGDLSTPIGVPLFPVQLVEALLLFGLFVALLIIFLKSKKDTTTTFVYCYAYAVIRFVLEFFRGDKIRGVFIFSTSQWISIAIAVVATVLLILFKKRNKSKTTNQEQN